MKTRIVFVLLYLSITGISLCQGWYPIQTGVTSHFLKIQFTSQNTGYISAWVSKILKTTNGGDNWFLLNHGYTGDFHTLYFLNDNTGWVLTQQGIVIKTTNGGTSWTQQFPGTTSFLFSIDFTDINNGYMVGQNGYYSKTTNSGAIWEIRSLGTSYTMVCIKFVDNNTGYISGDNGTIYKTTNAGISWFYIQSGVTINLGQVFFINQNTGWITGTNGLILKTINAGNNWSITQTPVTSWLTGIQFTDASTGWAVGDNGVIIKSTDGGTNWVIQSSGVTQGLRNMYFINANTGLVHGLNGTLLKTTTGGLTVPAVPVLISPFNLSQIGTLTPTLTWNTSSGAENYTVQVSNLVGFTNIVDSFTTVYPYRNIPAGKLQNNTSYFWRVRASNGIGTSTWTSPWAFSVVVTDIRNTGENIPREFGIKGNYPNPFNPSTKIIFDIPKSAGIKLAVHDALGREIETLFSGDVRPGRYECEWNASKYSSGIYFIRLESGEYSGIRRMALVK